MICNLITHYTSLRSTTMKITKPTHHSAQYCLIITNRYPLQGSFNTHNMEELNSLILVLNIGSAWKWETHLFSAKVWKVCVFREQIHTHQFICYQLIVSPFHFNCNFHVKKPQLFFFPWRLAVYSHTGDKAKNNCFGYFQLHTTISFPFQSSFRQCKCT